MRILLVIIVLVVIGFAVAPFFTGKEVEKVYEDLYVFDYLEQQGIQVDKAGYNKNWFGAKSSTSLTFPGVQGMIVRLDHNITHGPITPQGLGLANIHSELQLPSMVTRSLPPELKSLEPIAFDTLVKIDGSSTTKISSSKYEGEPIPGAIVNWEPFVGTIESDKIGNLKYDMGWPLFKFDMVNPILGDQSISLVSFNVQGEQDLEYNSNMDMSLRNFFVNIPVAQMSFGVDNIMLNAFSQAKTDMVDTGIKLVFDALTVKDVPWNQGEFTLNLVNLDREALEFLNKKSQEIMKLQSNGPLSEQEMSLLGMSVIEVLPDLLNRSPKIELEKVYLDTPYGSPIHAQGYIRFNGEGDYNLMNQADMMNRLDVEINVSLPIKLVKHFVKLGAMEQGLTLDDTMIEQQIEQVEAMGLLKREQNTLSSKMTFKQGELVVNGVPMPLGQFIGMN